MSNYRERHKGRIAAAQDTVYLGMSISGCGAGPGARWAASIPMVRGGFGRGRWRAWFGRARRDTGVASVA